VDTEEQARKLLVASCATNSNGDFIARELVKEQTLDNLYKFHERLQEVATRIKL